MGIFTLGPSKGRIRSKIKVSYLTNSYADNTTAIIYLTFSCRDKQKAKADERKEKEKKRTTKGERKR